jgi:hypothetical protein
LKTPLEKRGFFFVSPKNFAEADMGHLPLIETAFIAE